MPFTDDDATIAAALEDVSVPGAAVLARAHDRRPVVDPATGRSDPCRRSPTSRAGSPRTSRPRCGGARCRSSPRTATPGCEPHELPDDVLLEMMAFLALPSRSRAASCRCCFEDMQFDGADPRADRRGATRSPTTSRRRRPSSSIGCGESGILAGIRLAQAGLPFTIVDKNDGPGGTWWENRYPGARVDVGSHQYCYSFEPADHWSEYYCQQPELRDYFGDVVDEVRPRPALPVRHHGHRRSRGTTTAASWQVGHPRPPTAPRRSLDGPVRHQRRRLAEHPEAARHPGHGHRSPARRSTRRGGPTTSTSPAPASR